jgi:hypothetical protein
MCVTKLLTAITRHLGRGLGDQIDERNAADFDRAIIHDFGDVNGKKGWCSSFAPIRFRCFAP